MYKTETHLHTSEVSRCGKLTAAEMITRYHAAGYRTVFVTDHFQQKTINKWIETKGEMTWAEIVAHFKTGWAAAHAVGEPLGMSVILSAELRLNESRNHYLLYGDLDDAFFLDRPDMLAMSIADFHAYAASREVTVVQAHPLRDGKNLPTPNHIDAMEVCNPNPRHINFEDAVTAIARYHSLPMTGGSDAHRPEDVAGSGVLTAEPIRSAGDYAEALRSGSFEIIRPQ